MNKTWCLSIGDIIWFMFAGALIMELLRDTVFK